MLARIFRFGTRPITLVVAMAAVGSGLSACYVTKAGPFAERRTAREIYRFVRVERTALEPSLKAPGRVESSKRTIIKCELENLSSGAVGTNASSSSAAMAAASAGAGGASTMISLVPEGTVVNKGDIIARLDASNYEEMLRQQTIVVEQAKSSHLQAQLNVEIAQIALREYMQGTVKQTIEQMEADLSLARANLTQASERLDWSRMMNGKGYASVAQVKTDEQTFLTDEQALRQQELAYDLFQRFSLPKTEKTLQADITTAQTTLDSEQVKLNRQLERFAQLQRQVERCTIRAPHDGVVYYYFDPNPRFGSEGSSIEEGMSVRQEQKLFYLPDLDQMEVQVDLNESIVSRVHPGMTASVEFEAIPGLRLSGKLASISEIPSQESRRGEDVRHFMGILKLDHSAPGVKPGMSAMIDLNLVRREDILAIPHEAVISDRGQYDCYVLTAGNQIERRTIHVGKSTPELIEVAEGLKEGEEILLNPPGREASRPRSLAGFENRRWSEIALNKPEAAPAPSSDAAAGPGARRRGRTGTDRGGDPAWKSRPRPASGE